MNIYRNGLGDLGPLGNASSIDPGDYVSTGDSVNLRASPGGTVIGSLSKGDSFKADGTVDGGAVSVGGAYTNFARGTTGSGKQGWLAVEYLAPVGSAAASAATNAGAAEKAAGQASLTTPSTGPSATGLITAPTGLFSAIGDFVGEHKTGLLIGAAVVGGGLLLLAAKKKRRR